MENELGAYLRSNSLSDLSCTTRRTTGDAPPPLVGSSVTRLGDKIYVFGGRIVRDRAMVSTLYALDLPTLIWSRQWPPSLPSPSLPSSSPTTPTSPSRSPSARYFHSAEAWGNKIVFFGGQGLLATEESDAGGGGGLPTLETLSDLFLWDTEYLRWEFPSLQCREGIAPPEGRFAHLASVSTTTTPLRPGFAKQQRVTNSRLTIVGGQNNQAEYLRDICVLDLGTMTWVENVEYSKKAGSYRSLAISARLSVREGSMSGGESSEGSEEPEDWTELPYSLAPTSDSPEPVILFSNVNFDNPRRDIEILVPSPSDAPGTLSTIDLSPLMTGDLPPGIRSPFGEVIGHHLIIAGFNKAPANSTSTSTASEFVLWSLDLGPSGINRDVQSLPWKRIETGETLRGSSWNKAVGWRNSIVVLGSRDREIVSDYNDRRINFDHIAFIDLESHGIYQPPPRPLSPSIQSLALFTLSQPALSDFEILCSDGTLLSCSRSILEDRWPWFRREVRAFEAKTQLIQSAQDRRPSSSIISPSDSIPDSPISIPSPGTTPSPSKRRRILSVTPRSLMIPLNGPATLALLQFFYTLALGTPLQLRPEILCELLTFVQSGDSLPNLRALLVHALHTGLDGDEGLALLVFEAATSNTPANMAAVWAEQDESAQRQRDERARITAEVAADEVEFSMREGRTKSSFFDPLLRRPSTSTITSGTSAGSSDSGATTTTTKDPALSKSARVAAGVAKAGNGIKRFMLVTPSAPGVSDRLERDRPLLSRNNRLDSLKMKDRIAAFEGSGGGSNSRASVRISKLNISPPFEFRTELHTPTKSNSLPPIITDLGPDAPAVPRTRSASIPIDLRRKK
ncbi:hypothetical protein RQP46_004295 [Phenoliferia psychrophenolica]